MPTTPKTPQDEAIEVEVEVDVEVEVVAAAEVIAPVQRRLAEDSGGRVFDAAGRLERVESASARSAGNAQAGDTELSGCTGPVTRWLGRLFGLFAVLVLVVAFLYAGGFSLAGAVDWARANPEIARGGVVLFVTVMMPFMLPTGPIAIVPGYVWGEWEGLVMVLIGACLGGMLNMLLARRLVRARIDKYVNATPGLAALRRAIDARGFRIALALRLSPVTPYALVSYMAGLTGIRYVTYGLASIIGGVPWTLVYATAGSLLAAQSQQVTLEADVGPAGPWLRLVGFAFTIIVAVWIGRAARAELAAARSQMP